MCNLSHEEWIPAGTGMHEARKLLGTLSARDLRYQVSRVFDTDARQREALHADTSELAEGLPHAERDLIVATGKNDQGLPVGEFPCDEFQQQQRIAAGVVHIVDDQNKGPIAAGPLQKGSDRVKEEEPIGFSRRALRGRGPTLLKFRNENREPARS